MPSKEELAKYEQAAADILDCSNTGDIILGAWAQLPALAPSGLGTRVIDIDSFCRHAIVAIAETDFDAQTEPGQAFIELPDAVLPFVSCGAGPRSPNPDDYVLRNWDGKVKPYLRRDKAAPTEKCFIAVHTRVAYLNDPDVKNEPEEMERVLNSKLTHIIVTVRAEAGPESEVSPDKFVHNLAGGNNETLHWNRFQTRARAKKVEAYDDKWSVVSD